jgi:hypothetical protein
MLLLISHEINVNLIAFSADSKFSKKEKLKKKKKLKKKLNVKNIQLL